MKIIAEIWLCSTNNVAKNIYFAYVLDVVTKVSLFGAETYHSNLHLVLSFIIGIKIASSSAGDKKQEDNNHREKHGRTFSFLSKIQLLLTPY